MQIFDPTHTVCDTMPVYPGTKTPALAPAYSYEQYGFRETQLAMLTHTGTHIDAPARAVAWKEEAL